MQILDKRQERRLQKNIIEDTNEFIDFIPKYPILTKTEEIINEEQVEYLKSIVPDFLIYLSNKSAEFTSISKDIITKAKISNDTDFTEEQLDKIRYTDVNEHGPIPRKMMYVEKSSEEKNSF